jgi:hypothetical protein
MLTATPKPRVWTVFVAYVLIWQAIGTAGIVLLVIGMVKAIRSTELGFESDPKAIEKLIKTASTEPWIVLASAACSAFVLAGVALGAAKLSPTTVVERLRLGRAHGGPRRFAVPPLTAVAALAAGIAVGGALELLIGKKSDTLIAIENAMRSRARCWCSRSWSSP